MAIRASSSWRPWMLGGLAVAVLVGGYWLWTVLSPRESTDDAQVSGHVSPVAARVGGAVLAMHVRDNQTVNAGDVLVEIDPHDYRIALARAEADLAAAEAAARAARSSVPVTSATARSGQDIAEAGTGSADAALKAAQREVDAASAKLAAARARVAEAAAVATRAAQDLERLRPLVQKDQVPRQQFDLAASTAEASRAAVASAEAAVREAEANLDVATARRGQADAALAQARAQTTAAATAPQQIALTEAQAAVADAHVLQARTALQQAQTNLERTTVRAPANGVVSRRSVEPGQIVQPGQPLMAIATLDDVWVVANFKETQLRDMKAGQRAEVEVDAFGGHPLAGHVDSIAGATGATFSLLPPDNATGNFVKVVQRVPVKIVLDDRTSDAVLRPGMSVNATVYLR
ncbi:MAG: HlyD family secretion protein [Acidobacteria bacterium]|nr:HlyD family secretion protein [Acidobacteriota bacterium]